MKKKSVTINIPPRLKKAVIKYPTYGECFRALKGVKSVIGLAKAVMSLQSSTSIHNGEAVNMRGLYTTLRKILIEEEEMNNAKS